MVTRNMVCIKCNTWIFKELKNCCSINCQIVTSSYARSVCSEGSKVPIEYEFYGKMSQECSQVH